MTGDVGPLAHELPYWGWVDERTCLTRAGELVTVGALTPVVVDGRRAEDLDAVAGRWQRMLSGLPPEMRVSWIVERRPAAFDLRPPSADIAGLAQRKRQAFLADRVQDIDAYVVWSFDARLRQSGRARGRGWWRTYLAEWLRRRRAPHESVYLAADLARAVQSAAALVAASAARVVDVTPVRILTQDEAAAVLYRLVNGGLGAWVPGMRTDAGVNWRLAGRDVAAERQALHVGGEQFGIWSCVAPPATVVANALDELYALRAPMTVVLEWRPWSREAARRKLRSAQRHYFSKRYSMAAHMQEKEGTAATLEDAAASIEAKRAGAALVELETEGVAYGDIALSVAVRGTAEHLEQWGADIQRVFGGLDAKAARESYGQLAVWFGRLPGQPPSRQPRRVFVSAGVAAAPSASDVWRGCRPCTRVPHATQWPMWTRIRVTRTVRTIASWYCSSTRSCATTPRHAGQPAGSGAASSSSTCAGMSRRRFGPYLGPPFRPGFLGADCGVPFENGAAWRFRVRWAAASSCLSRSRSRRSRSRSDARRARSCCRRSRSCSKRAISPSFSAPSRRSPRLACWSSSTRFRDVRPKIRIHATIADARGFVQASPKNPMFPRVPTRYAITLDPGR